MSGSDPKTELIKLWMEKADDALESARIELNQGHTTFAVNRLYYSCFYAVTALLLQDAKQFTRHSAVRSEFVRSCIKTGKMEIKWGKFYQRLFDARQEADYIPSMTFEKSDVQKRIEQTGDFLVIIRKAIKT